MTKAELHTLYKELVIPESKAPYHFEAKSNAATELMAYNPFCGDKYRIFLQTKEPIITEAYFHGIGCAISKASTSFLMRYLEGKTRKDAIIFCSNFLEALQKENSTDHLMEELKVLAQLKNFEGRMDCVKLAWQTLLEHLQKSKL